MSAFGKSPHVLKIEGSLRYESTIFVFGFTIPNQQICRFNGERLFHIVVNEMLILGMYHVAIPVQGPPFEMGAIEGLL